MTSFTAGGPEVRRRRRTGAGATAATDGRRRWSSRWWSIPTGRGRGAVAAPPGRRLRPSRGRATPARCSSATSRHRGPAAAGGTPRRPPWQPRPARCRRDGVFLGPPCPIDATAVSRRLPRAQSSSHHIDLQLHIHTNLLSVFVPPGCFPEIIPC